MLVRLGKSHSQHTLTTKKQLMSSVSRLVLPRLQGKKSVPVQRKSEDLQGIRRYSVYRTIGTGAFARVKLARHKVTGEVVALKIMSKAVVLNRNQLKHVLTERRVLSQLRHPFIVQYKDGFQDQYFLYIVLEYVQGGDLYSLMAHQGDIEEPQAKFYACELFCALSYLHSQNVVYRDLKPENILITPTGHIKLSDFGFAKIVTDRSFTLCGTPEYLAPEIITKEGHNQQCDWWALGILLHEMLLGAGPFQATDPFELYEQILTKPVKLSPLLSPSASALLEMLLVKNPNARADETQIRNSEYFSGVDWKQVAGLRLQPRYRPRVKGLLDSSHFDKYHEAGLPIDEKTLTDSALFADFSR